MVKNVKGFSLVELMVVVAIVGLLTFVAFPSYQDYMRSSNRAAAQADLMGLAAALERHKAASFSYRGAALGGADTGKPAVFHGHSPSSEPEAYRAYDLKITSADGTSFIIEADPISTGLQSSDGSLFMYSDGRRAWDVNNNGTIGNNEFCWKC